MSLTGLNTDIIIPQMLIGDWAVVNGPTKNWGVIDGMGVDPGYMCFFVCVSVRVHFSRRRYRGGGERDQREGERERCHNE